MSSYPLPKSSLFPRGINCNILSLLKKEEKFRVETDTSGHAIEGVLFQEQEGKWKPIAFLSRTMQPVKRNYEIYDKELLAIVEALTK